MDRPAAPPEPDPGWALFLDVDGTLVEIATAPDAVVVPRRLVALLGALQATLDGAVALVSGRAVASLDALFAPLHLAAAGNHGLERRAANGTVVGVEPPAAALDKVRAAFSAFAAAHPGALVEDKALSVALHFRLAPTLAEDAVALATGLAEDCAGALMLQRGKMLVELRPAGGDKGSAIAGFMTEPPFAGRVPVFIGDDVTDEDGFRTVNALGGLSVRVGTPDAPTAAAYRMADIEAVYDWLARLAALPVNGDAK